MKKIKFRGKDADGIIHYGSYSDIMVDGKLICEIMDDIRDCYEVESESVAQFVGYDKRGSEIYSDDKIRVYDKICYAGDFFKVSDIGKTFDNVEVYMDNENEN